jgi:putative methyltransferase (TIGR04325 family)
VRSRVKQMLARVPPVRGLLEARYRRWFAGPEASGACEGLYPDFDSARDAIPAGAHRGYDTPDAALKYADRMSRIAPDDYPALFWVSRALAAGATTVVDFGGHIGVAWYAWREAMRATPATRWTVCDVPAVVAEGARVATERGESALDFTSDLASARGADIFLAQGSLQYVEASLGALLDTAGLPRHVVVHATPMRPGGTVWTLQNIGPAICPYALHSRDELLGFAVARGYRLVAAWENARTLHVPFHPEVADTVYAGFYLCRDASSGSARPRSDA